MEGIPVEGRGFRETAIEGVWKSRREWRFITVSSSYVGRILGIFFRETNLVAISPVVMFDAARLRIDKLSDTNLPDTNRFRYGIGSGLRFSLINVDFTAGYSFNPTRRLNEPRGAFVLRMDINDVFK